MAEDYPRMTLLGLPEELILQVVSSFKAIRSGQPPSTAFSNMQAQLCRQRENKHCQSSLHALCLTSKTLNRISTPILYSAFICSATFHDINTPDLFLNTIRLRRDLRLHIEYVENRLNSYRGNHLYLELNLQVTESMANEFFANLALIINQSPNLQHLCVVSIESPEIFLWRHVIEKRRGSLDGSGGLTHPKLQILALQTNTNSAYIRHPNLVSSSELFWELAGLSGLETMRASSLVFRSLEYPWRPFVSLRHIELTEIESELSDIDHVISQCHDLQYFECHWAFLKIYETSVAILPSLARHKNTLHALKLTANRSQKSSDVEPSFDYASICCLGVLKEAAICNFDIRDEDGLPGHVVWSSPLLSSPLPKSLERLEVLYPDPSSAPECYTVGVIKELLRFAADAPNRFPQLRELVLHSNIDLIYDLNASTLAIQSKGNSLEKAFSNVGIRVLLGDKRYRAI